MEKTTSFKSSKSSPGKLLLLFTGLFFIATLLRADTSVAEVVAIVNQDHDLTQISYRELRNIYLGKTKNWKNGKRIVLFLPKSKSASMEFFVKKILRLDDESEVSKLYIKLIFQQVFSTPPMGVLGGIDAVFKVMATPGGIAIVESSELQLNSPVKIIKLVDL